MVTNITSLTGHGMRDWLIQRVSAVILGLYTLYLFYYFITQPTVDYASWRALFAQPTVKIFSFFALLSLVAHTWIGIWTVSTDYIRSSWVRALVQLGFILTLIWFLAWGIVILWSI